MANSPSCSMASTLVDVKVDAYVRLVRTADKVFADVSRGLAEHNLTASQFSALKALRLKGPMQQKDVASSILKSTGNVTLVIDNLERRGLVLRTRGVSDRRVFDVALTDHGQELFDSIYDAHLERIRKAMGSLDAGDCEALISLLERLSD
jgi:MarR family transcriptional regulator, 2-MHQ and catechol-resistance regulon repressor